MRCFNHPDVEAVGTCKCCCKGLCVQCAADLGHGLACKGVHEQAIESLDAMIANAVRIQTINSKTKFVVPGFFAALGLAFLGFGLLSSGRASSFPIVTGCILLAWGVVLLAINLKAFRG